MNPPELQHILDNTMNGSTHIPPGEHTYLKYVIRETPEPQNWGDEEL